MEVYLVMKNNLKRVFQNKITYLWMLLIPAAIGLLGMLSTSIMESRLRIGLLPGAEMAEIQEKLEALDFAEYRIADRATIHTEQIMGTYQCVIDSEDSKEAAGLIEGLLSEFQQQEQLTQSGLSAPDRAIAMIVTVYLVIATLYAVKLIQDKNAGTVERFCLSGAGRYAYFSGYAASTAIIVAIQVMIVLTVLGSIPISGIRTSILVWASITGIATLYGVLHAFLFRKEMTANIMSSSLAIILSILGGTFVAVENMPVVLQWLSWLSPIRWLLEMIE